MIQATIRQGAFRAGDRAYLYVVDASGRVNTQGHLRKLGEKFGIAGKEMEKEANDGYAARHENLPVGTSSGIL